MGTWGTGLYGGDYAADLRSTIGAIMRLPFDGNRLLEILRETEEDVANNPQDESYTIFWLVAADQFLKRGIICNELKERALSIIEEGQDLAMMESLDMSPSDLKKRKAVLEKLRHALITPSNEPPSTRKMLVKPQPYLMEVGDCFAYPTQKGRSVNPYFNEVERQQTHWNPDGYGMVIIVQCGRAFDFLTWYRPLVFSTTLTEIPEFNTALFESEWLLGHGGTMSSTHLKRLSFEKIIHLQPDMEKMDRAFPRPYPGSYFAINDISMSNALYQPSKDVLLSPKELFISPFDNKKPFSSRFRWLVK